VLDIVQYKIFDNQSFVLVEANEAHQKVIIECLNWCWEKEMKKWHITIIGEEEEDNYSSDLEDKMRFETYTAYSEDIMNNLDWQKTCLLLDWVPFWDNLQYDSMKMKTVWLHTVQGGSRIKVDQAYAH